MILMKLFVLIIIVFKLNVIMKEKKIEVVLIKFIILKVKESNIN